VYLVHVRAVHHFPELELSGVCANARLLPHTAYGSFLRIFAILCFFSYDGDGEYQLSLSFLVFLPKGFEILGLGELVGHMLQTGFPNLFL